MTAVVGDRFVPGWDPWPLTARTRFVLWVALGQLAVAVDLALQPAYDGGQPIRAVADNPGGPLRDFPALTRTQPLVWWDLTQQAAGRMAEVMRTGQCWNPRTPAEEAVVHVAVSCGYTDIAFDLIGVDDDLRAALDALPVGSTQPDAPIQGPEADYTFDEVLPALTGDADIAILWDPGLDGLDDPQDPTNQFLGMGDYRPHRWHVTFGRYHNEPDLHTVVTQPTPHQPRSAQPPAGLAAPTRVRAGKVMGRNAPNLGGLLRHSPARISPMSCRNCTPAAHAGIP